MRMHHAGFWSVLVVWMLVMGVLVLDPHPWYDEGITLLQLAGNPYAPLPDVTLPGSFFANLLQGDVGGVELVAMLAHTDVHPPVYYMLADAWSGLVGDDVGRVRWLSVLMVGLGAGALLSTLPASSWGARTVGLCVFLASPSVLFAAGSARSYGASLGLLCVALMAAHKLVAAAQANNLRAVHGWWLVVVVIGFLAFLTHYFTIFVMLGLVVALLPTVWRHGRVQTVVGVVLGVVLLVLSAPLLRAQMGSRPEQYSGFQGWWPELPQTVANIVNQVALVPMTTPGWWLAPLVVLGIVAVGVVVAVRAPRTETIAMVHIVSVVVFLVALVALFAATDKTIGGSGGRYLSFVVPALGVLVARGWDGLWGSAKDVEKPWPVGLAVAATVAVLGLFHPWSSLSPWGLASDVDALERAVEVAQDEGVTVIIPRSMWDGAHLFTALDRDVRVRMVYARSTLGPVIKEASAAQTVVLLDAVHWAIPWIALLDEEVKRLEGCGFVETQRHVWRRFETRACF